MGIINALLNFACVLLWFNWRSARVLAARSAPVSLASTLKKTDAGRSGRWASLAALLGILAARTLFNWNVGSAWNWTASLELGVVSLSFRSDRLVRMSVYSLISFGVVLGLVYTWLLLLSVINRRVPDTEPYQRLVRIHLGWLERRPSWLKLALPIIVTALAWMAASPGLADLGIVPRPVSMAHLVEQSLLIGLASCLSWEILLVGVCLLYFVNSYVYLGEAQFWKFVDATGTNLLQPLRRLPLRLGKFDLSPLLAVVLLVLLARWIGPWLPRWFQHLPL